MNDFEKAWEATGRQYGEEELENVHLGWEMGVEHEFEEILKIVRYYVGMNSGVAATIESVMLQQKRKREAAEKTES